MTKVLTHCLTMVCNDPFFANLLFLDNNVIAICLLGNIV